MSNTIIHHSQKVILTAKQQEALNKLLEWTYMDQIPFFILKGSAGTGKTTVLRQFVADCRFPNSSIAVTAPTHKAKKVVMNSTGLTGQTIQSLLGLRPNTDIDNFDINKPFFAPIGEKIIKLYRLVIIDESSMLNADLHEAICKEAEKAGTKVLFVGDELQLPPVDKNSKTKAEISPALVNHDEAALTEVIRQADSNPITPLLALLREGILTKNDSDFVNYLTTFPHQLNEKQEGYHVLEEGDFTKELLKAFQSDNFRNNSDYCKLIAWTNASVAGYNKYIRNFLISGVASSSDNSIDAIRVDDLLMGYSTIYDEYNEIVLVNSEDYVVKDVEVTINDSGIKVFRTRLTSAFGLFQDVIVDIVHPQGIADFLSKFRELHEKAIAHKGRHWPNYYKFKGKHLLISDILDERGKLIVKKDLDYGYAITVHKTQGSTYENAFINLPNINRLNWDTVERLKLIYVAMSRASQRSYILNPTGS